MLSLKIAVSQLLLISSLAMAQAAHTVFGTLPDGSIVDAYTLHSSDVELRVITFGARVVSLKTKDRKGRFGDLALGYGSLDPYVNSKNTYFGATVGRYANRIAKGHFMLNGKIFQTTLNNKGMNTLHGGSEGFDRRNWKAKLIPGGVEFTLVSPDGDQGFPGTLTAYVRYTLHRNVVRIEYGADTDQPTVVNLTNHTYFNIAGEGSGSILNQRLTLYADNYTPVDTAIQTTEPAIQFNSGQYFDATLIGKSGVAYGKFGGLALETQHYPDSPNHKNFPSTELHPGKHYHSITTWTLSAQ
jgi:aldose 1-epimerase